MTNLPNHIFKNILAYCDDRIERQQKQRISNINQSIVELNNLQNIAIYISNLTCLDRDHKELIINDVNIKMSKYFVEDNENIDHVINNSRIPFINDDSFNFDWYW